jgi:hypothetical protein
LLGFSAFCEKSCAWICAYILAHTRCEVFTVVKVLALVFFIVTPCGLAGRYLCFIICCFCLQG